MRPSYQKLEEEVLMRIKLSVIVPVYNVENEIKKCLDSLISQTIKNIEIIVVDDGSTDNSPVLVDQYSKQYNNIRVIHQSNRGLSGARNAGLNVASGEYISFIDSDDYVDLNMFKTMVEYAEKYDADIAVCGRIDEYPDPSKNKNSYTLEKPTLFSNVSTMKKILT